MQRFDAAGQGIGAHFAAGPVERRISLRRCLEIIAERRSHGFLIAILGADTVNDRRRLRSGCLAKEALKTGDLRIERADNLVRLVLRLLRGRFRLTCFRERRFCGSNSESSAPDSPCLEKRYFGPSNLEFGLMKAAR